MPRSTDLPETLYHYTDSAGLLGILGNPVEFDGAPRHARYGTLWATDARYLNDTKELRFGTKLLASELKEQARDPARTPAVADRLLELAQTVRAGTFEMTWHKDAHPATPFVTCFSSASKGDLLSQWRGYGDGGGGFALGFARSTLTKFYEVNTKLHEHGDPFGLFANQLLGGPDQVKYGRREARQLMMETASEMAAGLEAVARGEKTLSWPDVFYLQSIGQLAKVKHKAFAEESEWRLITKDHGMKHPEFRPGKLGVIPYVKLFFQLSDDAGPAISEIVVGPGPEQSLRVDALKRLLDKIGCSGTRVRRSKAPFRG